MKNKFKNKIHLILALTAAVVFGLFLDYAGAQIPPIPGGQPGPFINGGETNFETLLFGAGSKKIPAQPQTAEGVISSGGPVTAQIGKVSVPSGTKAIPAKKVPCKPTTAQVKAIALLKTVFENGIKGLSLKGSYVINGHFTPYPTTLGKILIALPIIQVFINQLENCDYDMSIAKIDKSLFRAILEGLDKVSGFEGISLLDIFKSGGKSSQGDVVKIYATDSVSGQGSGHTVTQEYPVDSDGNVTIGGKKYAAATAKIASAFQKAADIFQNTDPNNAKALGKAVYDILKSLTAAAQNF